MAVAPKPLTQPTHEVHEFSSTRKWVIAASVMLGTVLEVLDSSIVKSRRRICRAVFRPASTDRVGRHDVPGRRGTHDPDDRMDRRALWPQALLRFVDRDVVCVFALRGVAHL